MHVEFFTSGRGPVLAGAAVASLIALAAVLTFTGPRFAPPKPPSELAPAPKQQLGITVPDVPEARAWLDSFFAGQQARAAGGQAAAGSAGEQRQQVAVAEEGQSWWQLIRNSLAITCGLPRGVQPTKRHLLVAPVGDSWNATRWLSQPSCATFDVAVIYYGSDPGFSCPLCSDVFRMRGPKWALLYNLTTSEAWAALLQRREGYHYHYVMLPDEDVQIDTWQLNTFFSVLEEFDAIMGQPSVCEQEGSSTWWPMLYQRPQHRVRFTTFLEGMAPAFRLDFYQAVVRHTLKGTYTGYGLDLVWPALLRYPEDKIAVVDQICMVHPQSPSGRKPGGLYDVTKSEGNEMDTVLAHFNYKPEVVRRMGAEYRPMKSLKAVDNKAALTAIADLQQHLHRDTLYQAVIVAQGLALVGLVALLGARKVKAFIRFSTGLFRSGDQDWKLAAYRDNK